MDMLILSGDWNVAWDGNPPPLPLDADLSLALRICYKERVGEERYNRQTYTWEARK